MDFLNPIKEKAIAAQNRIVLPESNDVRVLQAARKITDQRIAKITLIGDKTQVSKTAVALGVDISDINIILPTEHPHYTRYAENLYTLRKNKGLSLAQAVELMKDPLYFGTMMIHSGDMEGMVAGAANTTANVLRPALQIIKMEQGFNTVSGAFLIFVPECMLGHHGLFVFADCAVNINPDAKTLAEIGIQAAYTAQRLAEFHPVVSFLSFSTKGSAKHELVDKVVEAVNIAKTMDPALEIDGEFQADAALIAEVGQRKAPESSVPGRANVLIFPDLQSGNIGYKLVERLGRAVAVGPILQGLAKPINDLSRGCSVEDIINMAAITSVQAIKT